MWPHIYRSLSRCRLFLHEKHVCVTKGRFVPMHNVFKLRVMKKS